MVGMTYIRVIVHNKAIPPREPSTIRYFRVPGLSVFHPSISVIKRLVVKTPMARISRLSQEPDKLLSALGAFAGLPRCKKELSVALPINISASKTGFFKLRPVSNIGLKPWF
jgi:hypothetical protein